MNGLCCWLLWRSSRVLIELLIAVCLDATTTTYKNATYVTSWQIGINNVDIENEATFGPETLTSVINATTTSMYGTVLSSPTGKCCGSICFPKKGMLTVAFTQGFYVIPTVRIINVPAVTQANGQLACTTTSRWSLACGGHGVKTSDVTDVAYTAVFTGFNHVMQAYFSGQQGPTATTYATNKIVTFSRAPTNTTAFASTTVISFSTPYLHFPPRARTELTDDSEVHDVVIVPASIPGVVSTALTRSITATIEISTTQTIYNTPTSTAHTVATADLDNVAYGFLPFGIITWMLQNPDYAEQYPGLESCLPGGPSIIPPEGCQSVAPIAQEPVPDLTASNAVTFKGVGCFHPGNCPAAAVAGATSTAQSAADT